MRTAPGEAKYNPEYRLVTAPDRRAPQGAILAFGYDEDRSAVDALHEAISVSDDFVPQDNPLF
jgi:hypothetical protein